MQQKYDDDVINALYNEILMKSPISAVFVQNNGDFWIFNFGDFDKNCQNVTIHMCPHFFLGLSTFDTHPVGQSESYFILLFIYIGG